MKMKITPPIIYKLFILLMIATLIIPLRKEISFPNNLIGLILLFPGIYTAIDTKRIFKKSNTPLAPSAKPTQLHTSGIYRFTRNPMYLGIIAGLMGIAILTGIILNIIFPILYLMLMQTIYIKDEEYKLEKEFGNE